MVKMFLFMWSVWWVGLGDSSPGIDTGLHKHCSASCNPSEAPQGVHEENLSPVIIVCG